MSISPELLQTTNQDYGSFYDGRHARAKEIAVELTINDFVRCERRRFPAIAYDIMFDVKTFFPR